MDFPSIFQRYDTEFTDNLYDDQDWIRSAFNREIHTTVLDVACGTGRSSIQLLNSGVVVTGIDANNEALEIFQSKTVGSETAKTLFVENIDINLQFPEGKWDLILIVGNSIGIIQSRERLDWFFKWASESLNVNGRLLITMTFPENGPIPMGVEQPKKSYVLNNGFKYERSFRLNASEETSTIYLNYWQDDILVHQDVLNLYRYHWTLIKTLAEKYFGFQNVNYESKFSATGHQERTEPYEVFFKIHKV
jgi:SAM-dependent methyltransferase